MPELYSKYGYFVAPSRTEPQGVAMYEAMACSLPIIATNKVRGLKNVTVYAFYSILSLVLTREAATNIGRPDKAVSPTYFNT